MQINRKAYYDLHVNQKITSWSTHGTENSIMIYTWNRTEHCDVHVKQKISIWFTRKTETNIVMCTKNKITLWSSRKSENSMFLIHSHCGRGTVSIRNYVCTDRSPYWPTMTLKRTSSSSFKRIYTTRCSNYIQYFIRWINVWFRTT